MTSLVSQLPADPLLPEVAVLLGARVHEVVAAALPPRAQVIDMRRQQLLYQPGLAMTVRYRATVRAAGGQVHEQTVVLACGADIPEGAPVLEGPEGRIAVWQPETDPRLPGLRGALDPAVVHALLADLGVIVDRVALKLLKYRPARRAVVRVAAGSLELYLKVVPADRAQDLHGRHQALEGHVPVPRTHGWSEQHGLVVLQALPGELMRDRVRAGDDALPEPAEVVALLDALPEPVGEPRPDASPVRRHVRLLAAALPRLAGRLDELAGRIEAGEATGDGPLVPVHGDLHDGQLLLDDAGGIVGLLDVDDFGWGRRRDDLATLLGHLTTVADRTSERAGLDGYRDRLLQHADATVDPVALRLTTAGVVLGLATGPLRVLQPDWQAAVEQRVGLAEAWASSVDNMSVVSRSSHGDLIASVNA